MSEFLKERPVMELSQLKTFRLVAEILNFTRASERLHMTQSAVSHQIKALESELGEPLFIRAKRGVKLSRAGKIALAYVERILDEVENLRESVSGQKSKLKGRVRAAAATQAFVYLFDPLFEAFMRTHTGIEVSYRTTVSTEQTIADILNGVADVGFASLPIYSPNLQVTELFEDELVLVVGRKHELANKRKIPVEDIEHERLILFERGASVRRATDNFFKQVEIKPDVAMESNDTYFIKRMVEKGMGISLMPNWTVRDELKAGKLAKLKIDGHKLRRTVAMVSLGRFQPSATRAFVNFILQNKNKLQAIAKDELKN
jgi:LysR family transcriptional activator of glutamate synthase operon